jgi:hypothetical protein
LLIQWEKKVENYLAMLESGCAFSALRAAKDFGQALSQQLPARPIVTSTTIPGTNQPFIVDSITIVKRRSAWTAIHINVVMRAKRRKPLASEETASPGRTPGSQ